MFCYVCLLLYNSELCKVLVRSGLEGRRSPQTSNLFCVHLVQSRLPKVDAPEILAACHSAIPARVPNARGAGSASAYTRISLYDRWLFAFLSGRRAAPLPGKLLRERRGQAGAGKQTSEKVKNGFRNNFIFAHVPHANVRTNNLSNVIFINNTSSKVRNKFNTIIKTFTIQDG